MSKITNKDVCIVIPIYKDNVNRKLTDYEIESIDNTINLMYNYDIYFLYGIQTLDISFYQRYEYFDNIHFKYFDFKSIADYTKMCLNPLFYKEFMKYTYMLICQPDAYLFYDELLYHCNKGYDYLGAPFVKDFYRINDIMFSDYSDIEEISHFNGGLSLRNIQSFYKFCSEHQDEIKNHQWHNIEDMVICRLNKEKKYLKMPRLYDAYQFSIEQILDVNIFNKYFKKLPFGCHDHGQSNKHNLLNIINY